MKNLIAQVEVPVPGNFSGLGSIGQPGATPATTLAQVISTTIGLLTVIAALFFMFILITGAIGIISSGGDKGAFEDARRKITTGAIGLVVAIAAMFIMDIIATILGIQGILNLQGVVQNIRLP